MLGGCVKNCLKFACFSFKLHNEDDPPESSAAEQSSTSTETTQTPQTAAVSEADTSPPPYCSIAVEAAATSGIFPYITACHSGVCMNQHLVQSGTVLQYFFYAHSCSKKLGFHAQPFVQFIQKHASKLH